MYTETGLCYTYICKLSRAGLCCQGLNFCIARTDLEKEKTILCWMKKSLTIELHKPLNCTGSPDKKSPYLCFTPVSQCFMKAMQSVIFNLFMLFFLYCRHWQNVIKLSAMLAVAFIFICLFWKRPVFTMFYIQIKFILKGNEILNSDCKGWVYAILSKWTSYFSSILFGKKKTQPKSYV